MTAMPNQAGDDVDSDLLHDFVGLYLTSSILIQTSRSYGIVARRIATCLHSRLG